MGVAKHGIVKTSSMPRKHMVAHLKDMTKSAGEVFGYHNSAGVTGQSSQGSFSPGGASGADYETTNTGNVGDADSGGPQI